MKTPFKFVLTAAALVAFATTAHAAEGDVKKGEKVFKKCKACHAVGENAKKKVGPPLNNIIDAKAGQFEGFKYSKQLLEAAEKGVETAGGKPLVWSDENLDAYLKKPKAFLPKGKMAFAGLKKDSDRVNVIAYLKTFSEKKEGDDKMEEKKEGAEKKQ